MDPVETLLEIEDLYRTVLSLTREQEECLRRHDVATVPSLLTRKADCLGRAQGKMVELQAASVDRDAPPFQEGLRRLASVLAELVALEERCSAHARPSPPSASRGRAAAAYSSAGVSAGIRGER